MSVFQVEEYYISITGIGINDEQKNNIEKLLADEGCPDYEFQDGGLVVDGLSEECDAENLEQEILALIN